MAGGVVDLCVPEGERDALTGALEMSGYVVRRRDLASLRSSTDAVAVVIGLESGTAVSTTRSATTAIGDTPLVVIADGGTAGADLTRPLAPMDLVRKLATILHVTRESPSSSRPPPRVLTVELSDKPVGSWVPPERTEELLDEDDGSDADADIRDEGEGIDQLSPLHDLLMDADRRVFATLPPLQLRFPAGDESARDLVPDELLDAALLPPEEFVVDSLEAFTQIVALPSSSGATLTPGPPASWPPSDVTREGIRRRQPSATGIRTAPPSEPGMPTTVTELPAPRSAEAPRPAAPPLAPRKGELGEAELVRLLWPLLRDGSRVEVRLCFTRHHQPVELVLCIADGHLYGLQGPVAQHTLAAFVREGRDLEEAGRNEARAHELLQHAVGRGVLGRFELDRGLRRTREQLLHAAVAAKSLQFELRPDVPLPRGPRIVAPPLLAVLVEGARQLLSLERVRTLIGPGPLSIHLREGSDDALQDTQLEPEVILLLSRHDGGSLDALLSAASAEEGLAGAVFALLATGVLETRQTAAPLEVDGETGDAVRNALVAAARLAEDGDYFAVLGLAATATGRELRAAAVARRRDLCALNLELHHLEELEPMRDAALRATHEAWELLRHGHIREAYKAALGR